MLIVKLVMVLETQMSPMLLKLVTLVKVKVLYLQEKELC